MAKATTFFASARRGAVLWSGLLPSFYDFLVLIVKRYRLFQSPNHLVSRADLEVTITILLRVYHLPGDRGDLDVYYSTCEHRIPDPSSNSLAKRIIKFERWKSWDPSSLRI